MSKRISLYRRIRYFLHKREPEKYAQVDRKQKEILELHLEGLLTMEDCWVALIDSLLLDAPSVYESYRADWNFSTSFSRRLTLAQQATGRETPLKIYAAFYGEATEVDVKTLEETEEERGWDEEDYDDD